MKQHCGTFFLIFHESDNKIQSSLLHLCNRCAPFKFWFFFFFGISRPVVLIVKWHLQWDARGRSWGEKGESQRSGFPCLTAGACFTAPNNKDEDFRRWCGNSDNRGGVKLKEAVSFIRISRLERRKQREATWISTELQMNVCALRVPGFVVVSSSC